ncbi:hypothetical protein [Agromyces seonyuensis]|uniref:Hemagglutinin n=1 Tax=Agromyces seonyuensis TaxID=2662446 RepID=A0A6I4NWU5_9MICO|nr:hypothetical protein [Agromyces seonyuensis]MWB98763.1 hypothetical protein [Agromyces seonyuensis]
MDARTRRTRFLGACLAALAVVVLQGACAQPGSLTGAAADAPRSAGVRVPAYPEPDPAEFDPGRIVDDDAFYDWNSMSTDDVQDFLEAVDCEPGAAAPCLADYEQDTPDREADPRLDHCDAYTGARSETAAEIITGVARACGVSPRTLLVLLQKEQSLLTSPSVYGYERATGYYCPDTAPCEERYFGFFNQVYSAAWQFREYTVDPDWRYRIGTVEIAYDPDPACGASAVTIVNQATANLYNYTPYQPNAAVLANPGTADPCASWGNFNFWRLWRLWFGDPDGERFPGFLPSCTNLAGGHRCPSADALSARG